MSTIWLAETGYHYEGHDMRTAHPTREAAEAQVAEWQEQEAAEESWRESRWYGITELEVTA